MGVGGGGTDRAFLMPAWRSDRAALRTELSRTDRPSATLGVYTGLWLQFSLAQFAVIALPVRSSDQLKNGAALLSLPGHAAETQTRAPPEGFRRCLSMYERSTSLR